jgi:S-adenosylmethionine:tRNA ribosyltransferase-isomerase
VTRPSEDLPTSAFDYDLPRDLIARFPAARRDESRLMVLDRANGSIEHRVFRDIPNYFEAGDALVLNETRVFPARLIGTRESGAEAEVFLLAPVTNTGADGYVWSALVRPGAKLKPGKRVFVAEDLSIEILDSTPDGGRIVRLDTPLAVDAALQRHGRIPLPPYMERDADETDIERYQTVYAERTGSVAAPTAGLHFTDVLLEEIEAKGVRIVRIVLHVGVGTFRPVEAENPAEHVMHSEHYSVGDEAISAMSGIRAKGGSIWAVGTTVARTLESITDASGMMHAGSGTTDLFIRPGYKFKAVDHLITNFHLPRSTLMMLVAAFGGYELVMHAYREAIEQQYRFYSYGDAMVLV